MTLHNKTQEEASRGTPRTLPEDNLNVEISLSLENEQNAV